MYLPIITNPNYHYEAVNVYAEERIPYSLLNWVKKLIKARESSRAFGRGSMEILQPSNMKILAFLRVYKDESVLCVFNLSRNAQHFELELGRYAGRIPVEIFGGVNFPKINDNPYFFTLTGHRFLWLRLKNESELHGGNHTAS